MCPLEPKEHGWSKIGAGVHGKPQYPSVDEYVESTAENHCSFIKYTVFVIFNKLLDNVDFVSSGKRSLTW